MGTSKHFSINTSDNFSIKNGFALILVIITVVVIAGGVGYFLSKSKSSLPAIMNTFEDCVKAGNPIQESYPPVCTTSDGKSFAENISDKSELLSPQPDQNAYPDRIKANWKTYTDSKLNYSFQYPPTTCEPQREQEDTSLALCYLPNGSGGGLKNNVGYVISFGFISENQLNVMGITYCGANPNDASRCESFKIGKINASIDWGADTGNNASAWISHSNGGIITFNLQPVTIESKEILKQILSTFKFTNIASK